MGLAIAILVVAVAVLYFISIYNRLVTARNAFRNAFAQFDVQLTRRYELIPDLVETAKGYIRHEQETLEAVIAARNAAYAGLKAAASDPANAQALQQLTGAESQLGTAMGRLMVTVEACPDLKASQDLMQLSEELTSTDNRVAFARQAFNETVLAYNNLREVFPNSLVARSFAPAQLLELPTPGLREGRPRAGAGEAG